jgi:hypothetical protein
LSPFYFSLPSFPSLSTWSQWSHHHHDLHPFALSLVISTNLSSHTLRAHRLLARVSSIHQNQTRAFNLPLFSNWWQHFHKNMNWNHFEFMLLAQTYLPL